MWVFKERRGGVRGFIRVWKELNVDDIAKQLLLVSESSGICQNCKNLGIDYLAALECPHCKTVYKYVAVRSENKSNLHMKIKRLIEKRADLILIDYEDFKNYFNRIKAKEFFQ